MNASVLIVGSADFYETLLAPVQEAASLTIEAVSNTCEAVPLIQAQQPDVLMLQAEQDGSLDLCRQIKAQSRLAWIFCILVGDRALNPVFELNGDKELDAVSDALDAGADAVVWVPHCSLISPSLPDTRKSSQIRALQSQLRAGLRRVQNYRELIRANDLLSAIALSDPLTELNNRRALEWELPRQIHNARDRDTPISLIMLDVDYFKLINDHHGHLVGDRALKLVSARIRHNLRFYDTPFRYGGEEFVVILSETGPQEATMIAQRLCNLIAAQPFTIDDALDLTITISAGTATLQEDDDETGTSLIHRADQNLLQAKSQGRNRVVGDRNSR